MMHNSTRVDKIFTGLKYRADSWSMEKDSFLDYYEILQISSNADRETIDRIYRLLAKRYHPDNTGTGDSVKFDALTKAYRTLSDPEKRAAYDAKYSNNQAHRWRSFFKTSPTEGATEDRKIYQGILYLLYVARKSDTSHPGVGIVELERLLGFPENHLEFQIWYLKEKGWIQRAENGGFAITVSGVDVVIGNDVRLKADRLLPTADVFNANINNLKNSGNGNGNRH